MDMSTKYLGMQLKNPLVPSASPLSRDLGMVRQLEDAGASALVMFSLFEEELRPGNDLYEDMLYAQDGGDKDYPPVDPGRRVRLDEYLEHLLNIREAVDIPIIASLNGTSMDGWVRNGKALQEAGADALELNAYFIPADTDESSADVEFRYLELLGELRRAVQIPVTMKLPPQFSAPGNMIRRIERAGAAGVSLFNRFYQPDLDLERGRICQHIHLSRSADIIMSLRWIAILSNQVSLSMAATGGVHTAEDALKLIAVGADVTHLCSVLLNEGAAALSRMLADMEEWLEKHDYKSLAEFQGSMSRERVVDPASYERAHYVRLLNNYNPTVPGSDDS